MADSLKIIVDGVPELVVKMKLLEEKVRANIKVGMSQAVGVVQARAKEIIKTKEWTTRNQRGYYRGLGRNRIFLGEYGATIVGHVQSGDLGRSIKTKVGFSSLYMLEGAIGTDQAYAPFVEALPDGGFLEPALIEKQNEAWECFRIAFQAAIKGKSATGGSEGAGGEEE